MDNYLKEIYTSLFKKWILFHQYKYCSIKEDEENNIVIEGTEVIGHINFYDQDIVEYILVNKKTKENEFYLHFQFHSFQHAIELFNEMMHLVRQINKTSCLKVLLVCSGGLTTGYFAAKLTEAVDFLHLNMQVDARGYHEVYQIAQDYDMVLLAPQVSYLYSEVRKILKNQVVLKIPPTIFGKYDVRECIRLIEKNQEELNKEPIKKEEPLHIANLKKSGKKILCLSLIRNRHRVHILYRLYDENNEILENKIIIKRRLYLQDYYDIIDSMLVHYPDIEVIGLSTPGIIEKDKIVSISVEGLEEIDIQRDFVSKYKQKFIFENEANAVAEGFYAVSPEYENVSFIFQPMITLSGVGNVVNGKLVKGAHHISGEVQYLPLNYSKDVLELHKTPEGALEALSKTIAAITSIIDPQCIVFFCFLIIDIEDVKQEVEEYIPKEYLPDIIQVYYLEEYMLLGTLILCIEEVNDND